MLLSPVNGHGEKEKSIKYVNGKGAENGETGKKSLSGSGGREKWNRKKDGKTNVY